MPNVTGYYGVQTSIAYQNKCGNLGNSQPTSVPGMSKYTDSNEGFSFWYPSSWTVTQAQQIPITDAIRLLVSSPDQQEAFYIDEVYPSKLITTQDAACLLSIFFDTTTAEWMQQTSNCNAPAGLANGVSNPAQPANISSNTMGGLHEFTAGGPGTTQTIVPLSASSFVSIETFGNDNYGSQKYLADTIVATNPAVAIPVSTAQQTATIQAEASAYGVNMQSTSMGSTLDQKPAFTATPTSGRAPLTVSFYVNDGDTIDFGDGATGCSVSTDPLNCFVPSSFMHTYNTPGTYTVTVGALTPARTIGTATITVTGNNSTQPSASINASTLTTVSTNPVISGTATNVPYVRVTVVESSNTNAWNIFQSALIPVVNGVWSATVVPQSQSPLTQGGSYSIEVDGYTNPQGTQSVGTLANGVLIFQ